MSQFPQLGDGYYDDTGNWQCTKFCFVQCQHCMCQPPGLLYYSVAHDKRVPKPISDGGEKHG
jgi:hypothetical protein